MIRATLTLAWQAYLQQRSNHEQRLMTLTQGVLIFCLALLSFVMMSMQSHLKSNVAAMLGADLVIMQPAELTQDQLQYLSSESTDLSSTKMVDITLSNSNYWQAVQLKVVDNAYPIQGQLVISEGHTEANRFVAEGPKDGEIWLDSRVASSLRLKVGDNVTIGDRGLRFSALIQHEPDRLLEGHSVAMRAVLNVETWHALRLINLNIKHRYLLNAPKDKRQVITQWVDTNLPFAQVLSTEKGHPLAAFWKRTESVLGMSLIVLFLMGAIAIDLAARKQVVNQTRYIAVCMSSGMARVDAIILAICQWLFGFFLVLIPSLLLAYLAQYLVLQHLFSSYGDVTVAIDPRQFVETVLMLLLILGIFQVPMWLRLSQVSVANLVHQRGAEDSVLTRICWTLPALAAFVFYYADNMLLAGMMLVALLATVILVLGLTWLLLTVGHYLSRRHSGLLPFCLYMMRSRLVAKSTQILGIGLCAMLLLFTLMLMRDIGNAMERYTRQHDGNFVISQIADSSLGQLQHWANKANAEIRQMRQFTYAKLIRVEQKTLDEWRPTPSDSKTTLQKEIRLHGTNNLPANNKIVDGSWWTQDQLSMPVVSIEQEVMTDMGLEIGQVVTLLINQQSVDFTIVASHEFHSGAGSITFWLQVPEDFLQTLSPATFNIGTLEVSESNWHLIADLYREIPTIRAISLQQLTERFDRTLRQVTQFTVGFSIMILLLSLLVIVGAVKGFELEEQRKNGLLMSFGVTNNQCMRLYLYEWLITAFIAAVGAMSGTWIAGQLIYQSQFSLHYEPDFWWMIGVLIVLLITVCGVGMQSCKQGLAISIKDLLNQ